MPAAHVNLLRGHPRAKLRQVVSEISDAMHTILAAPKDRLEVWITEVDPELWGIAGEPASELLLTRPHAAVEMPFVQMSLMRDRPVSQLHAIIEAITAILVRVLHSERERIRVHIADVDPEKWGIGGVAASILRKAELDARNAKRCD